MIKTYTEIRVTDPATLARVLASARGCYQSALLDGQYEAWSGATLRGTARSYGYWYARSRKNLIARIQAIPGVRARRETRAHGRIVVVIEPSSR